MHVVKGRIREQKWNRRPKRACQEAEKQAEVPASPAVDAKDSKEVDSKEAPAAPPAKDTKDAKAPPK